MTGYCLLWDSGHGIDRERLCRIGTRTLSAMRHPYSGTEQELSGQGWWLGVLQGSGGSRIHCASDPDQLYVVVHGWLENRQTLLRGVRTTDTAQAALTDAQLVLELFRAGGTRALGELRGPFVAMVWQPVAQRLAVVRDLIGERACCYSRHRRPLLLASEEAAVLHHPDISATPNMRWLSRFASRSSYEPDETAFDQVAEVGPGRLREWWVDDARERQVVKGPPDLVRFTEPVEAIPRWGACLAEGIRPAVACGRSFGIMLSGGMDSTTVAAHAVPRIQEKGGVARAYCWRFQRFRDADESELIESTARHLNLGVTWLDGDSLFPRFDQEGWPVCTNLPLLNPFLLLNLSAYRAARADDRQVVLNGHLGDHLYPAPARRLLDAWLVHSPSRFMHELVRMVRGYKSRTFGSAEMKTLLRAVAPFRRPFRPPTYLTDPSVVNGPTNSLSPYNPVWEVLTGTINAAELKYLRFFADREGIDVRFPLRHHEIIRTGASLPSFLFYDDLGRGKHLTRVAMKGMLPDAVLASPRTGSLHSLFLEGVFGEGRTDVQDILFARPKLWPEVIRPDYVQETINLDRNSSHEAQRVLLAAIGIEIWANRL